MPEDVYRGGPVPASLFYDTLPLDDYYPNPFNELPCGLLGLEDPKVDV